MGNVLSASVPSLILPVEAYIGDLSEFCFIQSLGSTRFMKVAKVGHSEGPGVLKIFVHQDPSFSLDPYREQVVAFREALRNASNCCTFQKIILTEKCAILARHFGNETLHERLSSRPYLTDIEKRWIAYQLLKALEQCHQAGICHGDIKSQNVLISSWSWVQICDFASYKPSFLPYDNPSDFALFFDSSRRRSCYLAPERFVSTREVLLPDLTVPQGLTHAMDVFSVACVLTELFSDGRIPFSFSQLLSYREHPLLDGCLSSLSSSSHSALKEMLVSMLNVDPIHRPTARQLLLKYTGKVFPQVFDSFVYPYLQVFADETTVFSADHRLNRLIEDEPTLWHVFGSHSDRLCPSAILFVSLITSLLRSLFYATSKQRAIALLLRMSVRLSSSIVIDRILPHLVRMCICSMPGVQLR